MKHKPRLCRCKHAWACAVFYKLRGSISSCSRLAEHAYIFRLPRAAHLPMLSGYGRHVSGMV
jgi:hypothetical protein